MASLLCFFPRLVPKLISIFAPYSPAPDHQDNNMMISPTSINMNQTLSFSSLYDAQLTPEVISSAALATTLSLALALLVHAARTSSLRNHLDRLQEALVAGRDTYDTVCEEMDEMMNTNKKLEAELLEAKAQVGEEAMRRRIQHTREQILEAREEARADIENDMNELQDALTAARQLAEQRCRTALALKRELALAEEKLARSEQQLALALRSREDNTESDVELDHAPPARLDVSTVKTALLPALKGPNNRAISQTELARRIASPLFKGEGGQPSQYLINRWLNGNTLNAETHEQRTQAVINWLKTVDLESLGLAWDKSVTGRIYRLRSTSDDRVRPARRRLRVTPPESARV